ncbi:MAG: hypothetical protein SFU56_12155 [Capsulimonadales bacterium]|nr:hypothetical protein [Capsulimonadales bacterium]
MERNDDITQPSITEGATVREPDTAPNRFPDNKPPAWGRTVFLIGIGVFLLTLIGQGGKGWVTRLQLRLVAGQGLPMVREVLGRNGQTGPEARRNAEYARSVPNDVEVQIAEAISSGDRKRTNQPGDDGKDVANSQIDSLRSVAARFPDRPETHATVLRMMCGSVLTGVPRDENWMLGGEGFDAERVEKARKENAEKRKRLDPVRLSQFEAAARAGERCDPDNAFFPQMLAAVLFTQYRDEEAIAALHRAAAKRTWDDYTTAEVNGRRRQLRETQGETGTVPNMSIAASTLFPQYASMRSLARVATYVAAEKEKKGDLDGGFAIRHDMARIGSKMRVEGHSLIANLVGIAITAISGSHPGGNVISDKEDRSNDTELRVARKLEAYVTYLNRTGHPEEAVWFLAENQKMHAVKRITARLDLGVFDISGMLVLTVLWGITLLLLGLAGWLIVLGGVATLLSRTRHFREARPLPRGIASGGIAVASSIPMVLLLTNPSEETVMGVIGPYLLVIGVLVSLLKNRATPKEFLRNLGRFGATILTILALGVAVGFSLMPGLFNFIGSITLIQGMQGSGPSGNVMPFFLGLGISVTALMMVAITLAVSFFGRVKREGIPASVAVVRGMRNSAIGWAGVLLMLNVVLSIPLEAIELDSLRALDESIRHEGKALARRVNSAHMNGGDGWPGYVALPGAVAKN